MSAEPIESLLSRLDLQLRRRARRSKSLEVRQSCDDLRQDLFLRLCQHGLPSDANTQAYAVQSFNNLVKDCERACYRRAVRDVKYMRARPEATSDRVDQRAIRWEQRLHIVLAVGKANLRSDHRCALLAWCRDSLDEFAQRRGIPRSTASVWAKRARDKLRPYLLHLQDGDPEV